jgi:hypothetical protein
MPEDVLTPYSMYRSKPTIDPVELLSAAFEVAPGMTMHADALRGRTGLLEPVVDTTMWPGASKTSTDLVCAVDCTMVARAALAQAYQPFLHDALPTKVQCDISCMANGRKTFRSHCFFGDISGTGIFC